MADVKTKRNSPKRILEIVEAICENPKAATAASLSETLDIPVPTVYRWLEALCEEGYIAAHSSGHYVPGERFRNMTLSSLQYEPNIAYRRSILRKLSDDISETVSLAVPNGSKLVYFDRIESHWPFQANMKIGDFVPLHCSASGKLYLSSFEPEIALDIYQNIGTKDSARNTITDIKKFAAELDQIRKDGYSLDNEEWFNDMVGLSVPVFGNGGTLIACLSTHALVTRKSINDLKIDFSLMRDAALKIRKTLISAT